MSNNRDFKGKVVLVTGSSSGIGAATAIAFSKAGAQVVVTGRNSENVAKVAQECNQLSSEGLQALQAVADLSEPKHCKDLIDKTVKKFGRIDILVNNAGVGGFASIKDSSILDVYDRVMNTNLRSVVYLTHLAVEHLEKSKGVIINVSSVAGLKPIQFPGAHIYCASKSALDMFTKCLALELGPKGIRVNSVNPGAVRTNFFQAMDYSAEKSDQTYETYGKKYPLGRCGESQDIANAILFLSSNDSSFITGILLVSDGGGLGQ